MRTGIASLRPKNCIGAGVGPGLLTSSRVPFKQSQAACEFQPNVCRATCVALSFYFPQLMDYSPTEVFEGIASQHS